MVRIDSASRNVAEHEPGDQSDKGDLCQLCHAATYPVPAPERRELDTPRQSQLPAEVQTDWELVLDKGLRKSPPDEDAARQVVEQLANEKVTTMLNTRRLLAAATVGTVFEYRDAPERDAVASVYYDFVDRTMRAGRSKRKQGVLLFYHDTARPVWIHSDTKVGRFP